MQRPERRIRARLRGHGSGPRGERTAGFVERRRRLGHEGRRVIDDVGRTWLHEPTWVLDEDAAGSKVFVLQDVRPVEHGRHRDAQRARELDDLVDGVLPHPCGHDPGPFGPPCATTERGEVRVVEQIGPLDHQEEALEHLSGVRVEADKPVLGLLDRRRLEAARRRGARGPACEVGRQIGERRTGDRHDLVHREIDELTDAGATGAEQRGERGRCPIHPREVIGDAAPGVHRRLRRTTAIEDRTALSLHGELVGDAPGVRSLEAERCDAQNDEMGVPRAQLRPIDVRSLVDAHEVRGGHERLDVRVVECAAERALPPVQILEQRRIRPTELGAHCRDATRRITAVGFDLDDLGSDVDEQLRRVGAGDVGGEVDHAQVREHVHGNPLQRE
ncbi:unannotated protein [freshwater metagenome]|uniref:Unannotated protein n=1 Tax=freshwater metagenome TaxID=449393 RepID=A0A6J7QRU5_9ZZZZ